MHLLRSKNTFFNSGILFPKEQLAQKWVISGALQKSFQQQ